MPMVPAAALRAPPRSAGQGIARGLAWQLLAEAARARLGAPAWERAARAARAPEPARLDAFAALPQEPFLAALASLAADAPPAQRGVVLRDLGRAWAAAWARTYRALVSRLRGQPEALLAVFASEAHGWFFGEAGSIEDAGPAAALARLPGALPQDFQEGLLEGVAAAAGLPGARAAAQGGLVAVAWEGEAPARARPGRAAVLARALRAGFLPATLVPVLVGAGLAWRSGFLDPAFLGLTLLGVALLHLGANVANDYFDHRSRVDDANLTPTRFAGGSRVIQEGLVGPRAMRALAALLLAAGAGVGLLLAAALEATRGGGLAAVVGLGLVGGALGIAYSAPPLRLAHRGLGELAVGLGFGPLLVGGSYMVQSLAAGLGARLAPEAILLGVPLGVLVAAMLYMNEFPDRPWDARAGKRTLVVRLPERAAVRGYALLLALAYAGLGLAALLLHTWAPLAALLTLPLAVRTWAALRRDHARPFRLARAGGATLALQASAGLLLLGGLVLDSVLAGGA